MVTKAIGLKRLEKLADFMETVPRKKFNFNVIVGHDWGGKPDLSCGTTACALGWATTMPLFRRLGLYLEADSQQVEIRNTVCRTAEDQYEGSWNTIGREVFGISLKAMHALFQPTYGYPEDGELEDKDMYGDYPTLGGEATPKQWAEHARKMVRILQKEKA